MSSPVRVFLTLSIAALAAVANVKTFAQDQPKQPPKGLSLEQRGYWTLLNKPLEANLLTEVEYDSLWKVWPEPLRAKAEKASPQERREMALERFGFQDSPDRPAGSIPQQFTSDGKGGLTINCLACHGGKVAGKVVIGLGNSHFNEATFEEDMVKLFAQTGRKVQPLPRLMPAVPLPPVRGVNNAFGTALAFLSMRDHDLELTPDKRQFAVPSYEAMDMPMRTPPYWHARRKKTFYYDGFVEKTHRDIMQFSLSLATTGKMARGLEDDFKAVYAWINSVQPPKYSWAIDAKLADRGRVVFDAHCAGCHGKYGAKGSFPEKLITLADVGTDPVRANLSADFKKHLGQSWLGDYGKTRVRLDKGYMAPPLDGVWALAPYLHNGSVPTLWHLLNPDKRPTVWLRSEDGYDTTKVGLEVQTFDRLPDAALSAHERRLYYQTRLRGLGNEGHRYPAKGLTEDETRTLIEYLKSL